MDNMCRTCLKVSSRLVNIFDDSSLPHKIESISSVQVSADDNLPSKVCDLCARNIHLLYDFRRIIIKSNLLLRQRIESVAPEKELDPPSTIDNTIKNECIPKDESKKLTQTIECNSNPTNNFKCSVCEFTCLNYFQWKEHKRSHMKSQKSICSMCGKAIRKDNMRKHIMTHTEPPVQCQICGKTCKNTESLRGHLLGHKNNKLQCNTCGNIYRHRAAYAAHLKRHLLGDKKTVECNICSKLFYDHRTLKKHIRSHTGERPYPCPYCKKGFSSSNARNTHVRQHTNEKPYVCELCPCAFPQKVSLRTHLRSKHSVKIEKQEKPPNVS